MKELFTKKIYYKKFNHRLAIRTRSQQKQTKAPTPEVIEYLMNMKFGKEWRGITSSSYEGSWHRNRRPSINLYTVFFKNPEVFDYLEGIVGRDQFHEYEKPMDDAHTEQMEREKVITRTQLFHKKYRIAFRVPVKTAKRTPGYSTAHLQEMEDWCVSQFGPVKDNRDRYHVQRWTNGTFYFADPKDAVMFKMVWSENIGVSERVVLVSELEAARTPAVEY